MTHNEAAAEARKLGLTVECKREKLGRNKRRVTYMLLKGNIPLFGSHIGWKDLFRQHAESMP